MSNRVTQKDLELLVNEINESNGINKDAKHYTVGAYRLDYAYGGVKLVKINSEGGGQSTMSHNGFGTKKELYIFLRGFTSNL